MGSIFRGEPKWKIGKLNQAGVGLTLFSISVSETWRKDQDKVLLTPSKFSVLVEKLRFNFKIESWFE